MGRGFVRVRDARIRDVVRLIAVERAVQLPEILKSGRVVDDLPREGDPPLWAPLFMIATRGCSACTRTAGPDLSEP